MQKLLVICGPTATGKTSLAVYLTKLVNGEIISADSRQVYKYMDIGTGKDKQKYGNLLGYDLVNPNEEFSVSHFGDFANQRIIEIYNQNKLPILVGGTGLYIKAIIDNLINISVPRNLELRQQLAGNEVRELQEILQKLDSKKLENLNNSDLNNPRRLIRAIEVAKVKSPEISKYNFDYEVLMIGLTASKEVLKKRIAQRVDERILEGFEDEINFLKNKGFWNGVPSRTIGYKDWPDKNKWLTEEIKYAKRQMTWFKKDQRIQWFDISTDGWQERVVKMVEEWDNKRDAKKS